MPTRRSRRACYAYAGISIRRICSVFERPELDGADERGARRAEEDLWTRFVRHDVIDRVTGLRVLETLKNRPDDQLFASLSR